MSWLIPFAIAALGASIVAVGQLLRAHAARIDTHLAAKWRQDINTCQPQQVYDWKEHGL